MKKNRWTWTLGAAALLALSTPAYAGVSIDRASPSIGGCPFVVTPAHVYLQVPPGGGCDVGGAGPQVEVRPPSYGLVGADNIDALSANTATPPTLTYRLVFSGHRASLGQPGTPYRGEAVLNQAASDLWRTALTSASPAAAMAACAGVAIPPPHFMHRRQIDFNLIFSAPTGFGPLAGVQDNIDGVELDVLDVTGDQFHDAGTYYSLDAASPSLGAGSPADIFYAPAGGVGGGFAAFWQLGLGAGDDVDAPVVWDAGVIGAVDPGVDYVLFSLVGGTAADIFVSDFTGASCLFAAANQLGMRPADNVDGLDVIP
jgi:hypothetical protein